MTADRTCRLEPFLSPVVAQIGSLEQAGSSLEILTQTLESYLERMRLAVCLDLQQIVEECCGGGPGEVSFLDLTDTPDTYVGSANRAVAVNNTATGLTFVPFPTTPPSDADIADKWINFTFALIAANPVISLGHGAAASSPNPTSTIPALSTASQSASRYKAQFVTPNSTNQIAYVLSGSNSRIVGMGNFGFRYRSLVGQNSVVANQRAFWGLIAANTLPISANPTVYLDAIGFGYESGDTTIQVFHNDGAGVGSKASLGANFPILAGELYDIQMSTAPNSGVVEWTVERLNTGDVASGTINTDLPASTIFFSMYAWVGTGATAGVASMWFGKHYVGIF